MTGKAKAKAPLLSESQEDNESSDIELNISLEKLNLGPKKKLLVLGLDSLLIYRVPFDDEHKIPRDRSPDGMHKCYLVYKRPFLDDFMRFCFERFNVAIWSSIMEDNLDKFIDFALEGLRRRLAFAWGQRQCVNSGFSTLENKKKPVFLKDFRKIWETKYAKCITKHSFFSNTLLIDDEPHTALLNLPHTGIFPTKYKANRHIHDNFLGPGGKLRLYLKGLLEAEDVPSYVERHPFGQAAITPNHSKWNYYSQIVRHVRAGRIPAKADKITSGRNKNRVKTVR